MIRLHPFGELTDSRKWPDEVVLSKDDTIDPRCRAVVVGPGIGADEGAQHFADQVVAKSTVPIVLDADGISRARIAHRPPGVAMVVTPHGGELRRLLAVSSGNAVTDAQTLARELDITVLIKGPITVVADPSGETGLVTTGTAALATAGTGDVLAGMIGAALARGLAPIDAASLAATLHGLAGQRLAPYGQASRMDDAIRQVLRELDHAN
jgi:NAD(P)H-hydrate epimerase